MSEIVRRPLTCPYCGSQHIEELIGKAAELLRVFQCQQCKERWTMEMPRRRRDEQFKMV